MEAGEDDGRWMTYAELAKARGIDHQSARRMANRAKWRRQQDNHKVVRVYVPVQAERHRRQRDMSAGIPTDLPADESTDMPADDGQAVVARLSWQMRCGTGYDATTCSLGSDRSAAG